MVGAGGGVLHKGGGWGGVHDFTLGGPGGGGARMGVGCTPSLAETCACGGWVVIMVMGDDHDGILGADEADDHGVLMVGDD